MTARKRKPNPKYNDDSPVKKAKIEDKTPTKRTAAPRAAKVNRSDPEWLVTNEKSPLAYENLHAELSDPKTYEGFTKEDWEDLRSILPDNVPLNPDGYSIATNFLKYDPDFRNGVREFQEDLGSGRLDPKWLAAAADAMEERARGEFDVYKENEYEEFWGQKQKLSRDILAGESTTLKLEVMIEHGVFRVGDEIVFSRTIGRKEKRVLFEKECKIVGLGKKTMTLAIPPGRLKFARQNLTTQASPQPESSEGGRTTNGVATESPHPNVPKEELDGMAAAGTRSDEPKLNADAPEEDPVLGNFGLGWKTLSPIEHDGETSATRSKSNENGLLSTTFDLPCDDVILYEIKNLKQLNDKIIEIDGRLNPKNQKEVPAVSPWKLMRAKRNNQDLGSLFEMRDEFYVYKLPQLVKTSKK